MAVLKLPDLIELDKSCDSKKRLFRSNVCNDRLITEHYRVKWNKRQVAGKLIGKYFYSKKFKY